MLYYIIYYIYCTMWEDFAILVFDMLFYTVIIRHLLFSHPSQIVL